MDIQHIGSTAIDGIAAKPLLDILVGVKSMGDAQKFDKHKLKEANIYHLGRVEIEGKEVFAKFSNLENLTKTHVLHVVEYGGDWWQKHIFFRDYLNEHPEVAKHEVCRRLMSLDRFWEYIGLLRTETELDDGTEFEEKGIVGPLKIHSMYIRVWKFKTVFILDVREGFKRMKKDRNKFKLILGLVSK